MVSFDPAYLEVQKTITSTLKDKNQGPKNILFNASNKFTNTH